MQDLTSGQNDGMQWSANVTWIMFKKSETHHNQSIRQLPTAAIDLAHWPAGEMGLGVIVIAENLSEEERARKTNMFSTHAFEEYASELISVERNLPDWRDPWCELTYPPIADLPATSVIMCFHNEARSTLLRSLHSVLNRSSPDHLLLEILLLDDASTLEHPWLEEFLLTTPQFVKVRLVRLMERHGLVRCRLQGIEEARGEVLTFLDSHVEVGHGWLLPLLHGVRRDRNAIMCPTIDVIDDTTFHYQFVEKDLTGLLTWGLEYEWYELTEEAKAAKPHPWAPHPTPVMAGGIFSIHRNRFIELGLYDRGMHIWGGENMELSFKAWMCPPAAEVNGSTGRRIEIVPCSRVGHVFRSWSPYNIQTEQIHHNNIRVAEVWMDEFKYLYLDRFGDFDKNQSLNLNGDIAKLQEQRAQLKCRSFSWYLSNVAAAAGLTYPLHLVAAGEIRNVALNLCLQSDDDHQVHLLQCHSGGGTQYWWMDAGGLIYRDHSCLVMLRNGTVAILDCSEAGVGIWSFTETTGNLVNSRPGLSAKVQSRCLTVIKEVEERPPHLMTAPCGAGAIPEQVFKFTRYKRQGLSHLDFAEKPIT